MHTALSRDMPPSSPRPGRLSLGATGNRDKVCVPPDAPPSEREAPMRLLRKTIVLGLAAFGAYRIYELVRPKAEQLAAGTGAQVADARDRVESVATTVKEDVAKAKDDVVSAATTVKKDVAATKDDVVSDLRSATEPEPGPVHTEAPQVGLG
jgi:hypothetical protein